MRKINNKKGILNVKNIKGQEGLRVDFLIGLALFLVVLFIIFRYLAGPGQEPENRLKTLLPGFNFSTTNTAKSQIIGYSIMNDAAKYYDSLNWQDFPTNKKITFNEKDISGERARNQFIAYYYNPSARKDQDVPLDLQTATLIYPTDFPGASYCLSFSNGYIINMQNLFGISTNEKNVPFHVNLLDKRGKLCDHDRRFGIFNSYPDGKLTFSPINIAAYRQNFKNGNSALVIQDKEDKVQNNDIKNEVSIKTKNWLDSVLLHPMQFVYDKETDINYFCVKKIQLKNEYYLIIDLSKPVGQGEQCSQ